MSNMNELSVPNEPSPIMKILLGCESTMKQILKSNRVSGEIYYIKRKRYPNYPMSASVYNNNLSIL